MVLSGVNTREIQSKTLETLETSYDQKQELEIQILIVQAYETFHKTWVGVAFMRNGLFEAIFNTEQRWHSCF
jgi:hypothetical protein